MILNLNLAQKNKVKWGKGMKKKVFFIVFIILIVLAIGCFAIYDFSKQNNKEQEEKLKTEMTEIGQIVNAEEINMDELENRFNRTVTKGDYAKVEKAAKAYMKDYTESLDRMIALMNNDRINTLIKPSNFEKDGPEFRESKAYIEDLKEDLKNEEERFLSYLEKENIEKYIENEKVSDKYKKIYLELTRANEDQIDEKETITEAIDLVTGILNKAENVIEFLKANKNDWSVKENKVVFTKDSLKEEYDNLIL